MNSRKDNQVDPRLVGIRGWLLLPVIGLVVCALVGSVVVFADIWSLVKAGVSNEAVHTLVAVVLHASVLLYAFVALVRFLGKRRSAPRTCIRLAIIGLVASALLIALEMVVLYIDSGAPFGVVFLIAIIYCLVLSALAAAWILYFERSKRVKATFTKLDPLPSVRHTILLPRRYLAHRRVSWLALTAVALCVFIVVVVMTIMTGLVEDFKQKNHDFVADCVVGTDSLVGFPYYEEFVSILEGTSFVEAVSPVVEGYGLLNVRGDNDKRGVEILGVDPNRHARTTNFALTLHYRVNQPGKAFEPNYAPNAPGCVLGIDMALPRDLRGQYAYEAQPPEVAITLTCFPLTARGAPARAGTGLVETQQFYYSDHARTGIAHVDGSQVYIPLEQAQKLCMAGNLPRVNAIHVRFRPGVRLSHGCDQVAALWRQFKQTKAQAQDSFLLDTVRVQDWKEYRRAFIAPMEKEQVLLSLMFILVGVTTVFIVFVVFYMIVSHKRKDVGVLKSLGSSSLSIIGLFARFAFAIGLIGSCVGVLAGWLFLWKINWIEGLLFRWFHFQLWDRSIYAIGDIPSRLEFHVLAAIVGCAILSCLVGALFPAYSAARLRPVETLHNGPV
jgi:lipoprotein-releasing system permease protein